MTTTSRFGKYRLIAELGHGGMADVFLAAYSGALENQNFNKLLVIKRLRANLADEEDFVSMLLDEGRLAVRLNHPNVVQTYEIGEQEGRYFIAMEYLDGQPLHRLINRSKAKKRPLSFGMGMTVIVDVLAGLQSAHDLCDFDGTHLGVVHRDISPQNVFVTYNGQVKVVDFGIAKAMGRSAETREGVIKGKITYMAPEQVMGSKEIDRRADLFAVGVMLYEMITDERLWKGLSDVEIVQRLLGGNFERHARSLKPDVPEELDRICAKALAPKKADRYATALDFQNDLEQFLRASGQLTTGREMGTAVSALFADKRAEVKQIIEMQLKRLATEDPGSADILAQMGPASGPLPSATNSSDSFSRPRSALQDQAGAQSEVVQREPMPGSSETIVGTVSGRLGRRAQSGGSKNGIIGAALLVIGVVGFVAYNRQKSNNEAAITTESASSAGGEGAMLATNVELVLRAEPSEARFYLDNGPPLANPYISSRPRSQSTHFIRVVAPGYKERSREVTFSTDVVIDLTLERDGSRSVPATGGGGGGTGGGGGHRAGGDGKHQQRPIDKLEF